MEFPDWIQVKEKTLYNENNSSRREAFPQIQGKVDLQIARCYQSELHPLDYNKSIAMDESPVCIFRQDTATKSKTKIS